MAYKEMTIKALYDAADDWEQGGYNPYTAEIRRRESIDRQNTPRTSYDVLRDIARLDCAIARECGTYDAERITKLQAELEELDQSEK